MPGLETVLEALIAFVKEYHVLAAPLVFLLAFGESLAFVSLILPFWGLLVGLGFALPAAGNKFLPIWIGSRHCLKPPVGAFRCWQMLASRQSSTVRSPSRLMANRSLGQRPASPICISPLPSRQASRHRRARAVRWPNGSSMANRRSLCRASHRNVSTCR